MAGQRVRLTPWPAINARLQFTSVFLSSLDAVTWQGRGGLCCAAHPDGAAEWVCPRSLLLDMAVSEGESPSGERETLPPLGLLGPRSESLLGKGLSVPISCQGS